MAGPKVNKTLAAVFANPLNGNLHWRDVEAMLDGLGAEKREMSGSAVAFKLADVRAVFDRPHPRKECGRGLVKRVRAFLAAAGVKPDAGPGPKPGENGESREVPG